ncbi:MAG TPA: hypothetical protein VK841_19095 [Polyangiaceae bacterium]|jgi:hypothetical protein|nr:hypothetical protein [Polyangiaceae bacterium]
MANGPALQSRAASRGRGRERARTESILRALAPALAGALVMAAAACATGADGVDACKQIEETRCKLAPACGIALQPPYSTAGTDVDACIRYYDIACLHGLEVGNPGTTAVNACVAAITDCATVVAPQNNPACAWLSPVPIDAGEDTPVVDAGTD